MIRKQYFDTGRNALARTSETRNAIDFNRNAYDDFKRSILFREKLSNKIQTWIVKKRLDFNLYCATTSSFGLHKCRRHFSFSGRTPFLRFNVSKFRTLFLSLQRISKNKTVFLKKNDGVKKYLCTCIGI